MLSVKTLASGNISFTNHAHFLLPLPSHVLSILYSWTPGNTMENKWDLSIQAENQALWERQRQDPEPHNATTSVLCHEPQVLLPLPRAVDAEHAAPSSSPLVTLLPKNGRERHKSHCFCLLFWMQTGQIRWGQHNHSALCWQIKYSQG